MDLEIVVTDQKDAGVIGVTVAQKRIEEREIPSGLQTQIKTENEAAEMSKG
jgi:hypothetical protein